METVLSILTSLSKFSMFLCVIMVLLTLCGRIVHYFLRDPYSRIFRYLFVYPLATCIAIILINAALCVIPLVILSWDLIFA